MTGKHFLNAVTNSDGEIDVVQLILTLIEKAGASYCLIGGLAVNAYSEPVVSLDMDIVVVSDRVHDLVDAAKREGLKVEENPHSINLSTKGSDLRVQIQTDPRYQPFVSRAEEKPVLGYNMRVANIEDLLLGKLWAYSDDTRRRSKRQKDLSDIMRLVEDHPNLRDMIPPDIRAALD